MHERLSAKDAEESISMTLGVRDGPVERVEINGVLLLDIHPATLAPEVAGVENRDVKERREELAAFDAPLEFLHREHAFEAEIPEELRNAPLVSRAQGSEDESG